MPIISNGSYYLYKKNFKNRQKSFKFLPLLMFFGIVLAFFGTFYAFSKFDFLKVFNVNKFLIYQSKSYFAISIYSGEREEVISHQTEIKASGGAGYIYKRDEKYFLLTSVYQTEQDAKSVAEKLINYQPEIIAFNFDNLILSTEYSSEQISVLKYAICQIDRTVEEVEKIVSSFDLGEILEGEGKQKLQIFANLCQQDKESLSNAFPSCCDNIVVNAKIFCNQTISNISVVELSQNFSSDAKKLMIESVINFENLQKNVKK